MNGLSALFDAFAAAASPYASLQLHGDDVADALIQWAIEHGHGAESVQRERSNGDGPWIVVEVRLRRGAWIAAHRETLRVAAAPVIADPIAF